MTNQTVTLDAKVVDQVIDALDAGYTPGLKDALKVLRAAKADSRTGETTMTTLQESARKALACLELYDHEDLASCEARHELRAALAVTAAGEREAGFTTGHCKEHAKPGGCQLHNLQCGYPACDRRAV